MKKQHQCHRCCNLLDDHGRCLKVLIHVVRPWKGYLQTEFALLDNPFGRSDNKCEFLKGEVISDPHPLPNGHVTLHWSVQ